MRSHVLPIFAVALVAAILLPAASPAPTDALTCPDPDHVTVPQLIALAGARYDYWGENPRAHRCFGNQVITVRGFANWTEGIGGTSTSGIRPAYFEWPAFFLFATSKEVEPGYGSGKFYGIVVPRRLGAVEQRYHREWVVVRARFGDPLANVCRGYGPKGDRPTKAQAIASCRDRLVMVSITRQGGVPSSDAPGPAGNRGGSSGPGPLAVVLFLVLAAVAGTVAGWRRTAPRPA